MKKEDVIKRTGRNARKAKKSNAGLVLLIIVILGIIAALILMRRMENDGKDNSEMAEVSNRRFTNLPQLAEDFYGNPVFWVYIYEDNKQLLSSPVNIPSGLELRIPDLKASGIDVQDSLAITKAKILGNKLLDEIKKVK